MLNTKINNSSANPLRDGTPIYPHLPELENIELSLNQLTVYSMLVHRLCISIKHGYKGEGGVCYCNRSGHFYVVYHQSELQANFPCDITIRTIKRIMKILQKSSSFYESSIT